MSTESSDNINSKLSVSLHGPHVALDLDTCTEMWPRESQLSSDVRLLLSSEFMNMD